jgi:hypothetical protein
MPHIDLWEPSRFAKAPDGPQTYTLNILWLQEEGAQIRMKPELHTHKKCGQRFHPLFHTSYTVDCLTAPVDEDVSSRYYVQ